MNKELELSVTSIKESSTETEKGTKEESTLVLSDENSGRRASLTAEEHAWVGFSIGARVTLKLVNSQTTLPTTEKPKKVKR